MAAVAMALSCPWAIAHCFVSFRREFLFFHPGVYRGDGMPQIGGLEPDLMKPMTKLISGGLAYILPTFPLGYFWHLKLFQAHYKNLGVYREDMIIPLGLLSMLIQAAVYSWLYSKLFAGLPVLEGALKFAAIAFPLSLSFMVFATAAKHHMKSPSGYIIIESCFVLLHFLVVSPLIAYVYRPQA